MWGNILTFGLVLLLEELIVVETIRIALALT